MARKRMISPTIWEDPGFNKMSHKARLAFIGMFSNADDYGYLRGDYGSLKRLIYGFDKEDDEQWLPELKTFKNLHFFEESGEVFAHLLKWHDYQIQQKDRIQKSTLPKCSICLASGKQTLTQVSKLSRESKEVSKGRQKFLESGKRLIGKTI